jgi:hypothetical protein
MLNLALEHPDFSFLELDPHLGQLFCLLLVFTCDSLTSLLRRSR